MSTLQNRSVIVTGAGSGIGSSTAKAVFAEGASVVAADINQAALDTLADELGTPERVFTVTADISLPAQTEALVEQAAERFGALYGLVNTAGITCEGSVLDVHPEAWRRTQAVNVDGTLYTTRAFAKKLISQDAAGAVVNFSSGAGIRGVANRIAYVAAKFAVTGMTYTMAMELAEHAIRVNAVAPGMVRTPLTEYMFQDPDKAAQIAAAHPIGRAGYPHEIANTVAFLLSDKASFMTGAVVSVDGGQTIGI